MRIEDPYRLQSSFTQLREKLAERDRLSVNHEKREIRIRQDYVEITIDDYPAQYDIGYRRPLDITREQVQESMEFIRVKIGEIARTGDRLMDFQNNDVALIAAEQSQKEAPEVNIGYRRPPELEVKPHMLKIESTEV